MTTVYFAHLAFCSYCEWGATFFFYTPLYLIVSYVKLNSKRDVMIAVHNSVEESLKDSVDETVELYMTRALAIAIVLTISKYLEALDVTQLTIKTWSVQKSQKELETFFASEKQGILIYQLKPERNPDSDSESQSAPETPYVQQEPII